MRAPGARAIADGVAARALVGTRRRGLAGLFRQTMGEPPRRHRNATARGRPGLGARRTVDDARRRPRPSRRRRVDPIRRLRRRTSAARDRATPSTRCPRAPAQPDPEREGGSRQGDGGAADVPSPPREHPGPLGSRGARSCPIRRRKELRVRRGTYAARIFCRRVAAARRPCDVDTPWRRIAATPRLRRGYIVETGRGDAAAATWIFRGDESRRRRDRDVDIPWRGVPAAPRPRRGYSVETNRGDAAAA